MTNVEKLNELGVLGEVRLRHGAKSKEDSSRDFIINQLSNLELVASYCGYVHGHNYLWYKLINLFNDLNSIDNERKTF
jgi:hypothetical protein